MIVDFHCHLVPPDTGGPVPPLLRDADGLLDRSAATGIDHVVVLNAMVNVPGSPVDNRALDRVQRWNEFGLDLRARHPDRVSVFAGVDPLGGSAQLEEAQRAVAAGSSGLTIAATQLEAPPLEEFWALAEELDVPVFVHPSGDGDGGDPRLAQFGTRAAELGLGIAAAIFAGVLDRYPELRLVVGAGAGGLASLAGRLDAAFATGAIGGPAEPRAWPLAPPSTYLCRIHVDTLLFSEPALRCALDVFGPDRLLFGSDSPLLSTPPTATWDLLPEDVRARVSGGNAAELLGLVSDPAHRALTADHVKES